VAGPDGSGAAAGFLPAGHAPLERGSRAGSEHDSGPQAKVADKKTFESDERDPLDVFNLQKTAGNAAVASALGTEPGQEGEGTVEGQPGPGEASSEVVAHEGAFGTVHEVHRLSTRPGQAG
jgi:hypothetical protein